MFVFLIIAVMLKNIIRVAIVLLKQTLKSLLKKIKKPQASFIDAWDELIKHVVPPNLKVENFSLCRVLTYAVSVNGETSRRQVL